MKIQVKSLPSIGKRIPVNGNIYNPIFNVMVMDALNDFAVISFDSELPKQFLQENIKRVEPDFTIEEI